MIRMLIVGSWHPLGAVAMREVHLNLAYRWFCRLGLEGNVPDHSTFSKNRHGRFRDNGLLRKVFDTVVERCMAEGACWRRGLCSRRRPDQGRLGNSTLARNC
jgi:IS5 family transposase